MIKIQAKLGDITKFKGDAIVNAANNSLMGGGGVDGAIHHAAGPELNTECMQLNGCKTGEAKLTKGYQLPASYIIHTVGPIWHGDHTAANLLAACYQNALELAVQYNLKTIAFPSISTGAYGYPLDAAAKVAIDTIKNFSTSNELLVTIVCFDIQTLTAYQSAIADN